MCIVEGSQTSLRPNSINVGTTIANERTVCCNGKGRSCCATRFTSAPITIYNVCSFNRFILSKKVGTRLLRDNSKTSGKTFLNEKAVFAFLVHALC